MMRSRRFQFQVAVLLVSLVFILAILGAYAYVGMGYAQGLPGDRRQLAAIAAQLAPAGTGRLRPWVLAKAGGGADKPGTREAGGRGYRAGPRGTAGRGGTSAAGPGAALVR